MSFSQAQLKSVHIFKCAYTEEKSAAMQPVNGSATATASAVAHVAATPTHNAAFITIQFATNDPKLTHAVRFIHATKNPADVIKTNYSIVRTFARETTNTSAKNSTSAMNTLVPIPYKITVKKIIICNDDDKKNVDKEIFYAARLFDWSAHSELHGVHNKTKYIYLCQPFIEGDIFMYHEDDRRHANRFLRVATMTASAVIACHAKALVHCDIKGNNLIVDYTEDKNLPKVKLIDAGRMRSVGEPIYHANAYYLAPEARYRDINAALSADIFSLGVLYTDTLLFYNNIQFIPSIRRRLKKLVMLDMQNESPNERPSITSVQQSLHQLVVLNYFHENRSKLNDEQNTELKQFNTFLQSALTTLEEYLEYLLDFERPYRFNLTKHLFLHFAQLVLNHRYTEPDNDDIVETALPINDRLLIAHYVGNSFCVTLSSLDRVARFHPTHSYTLFYLQFPIETIKQLISTHYDLLTANRIFSEWAWEFINDEFEIDNILLICSSIITRLEEMSTKPPPFNISANNVTIDEKQFTVNFHETAWTALLREKEETIRGKVRDTKAVSQEQYLTRNLPTIGGLFMQLVTRQHDLRAPLPKMTAQRLTILANKMRHHDLSKRPSINSIRAEITNLTTITQLILRQHDLPEKNTQESKENQAAYVSAFPTLTALLEIDRDLCPVTRHAFLNKCLPEQHVKKLLAQTKSTALRDYLLSAVPENVITTINLLIALLQCYPMQGRLRLLEQIGLTHIAKTLIKQLADLELITSLLAYDQREKFIHVFKQYGFFQSTQNATASADTAVAMVTTTSASASHAPPPP